MIFLVLIAILIKKNFNFLSSSRILLIAVFTAKRPFLCLWIMMNGFLNDGENMEKINIEFNVMRKLSRVVLNCHSDKVSLSRL